MQESIAREKHRQQVALSIAPTVPALLSVPC